MNVLRTLQQVFCGLKHKRNGFKRCPVCLSNRIRLSSGLDVYPKMYGVTSERHVCEACGYTGNAIIETEDSHLTPKHTQKEKQK